MAPQRIGSHYLLHEQIGQGGMGAVWRAEDTDAAISRAVKVLKPEYAHDPGAVARFVRERNALMALRHPNVVTLHDMLVEGERLALVMDLLTEGDLDKFRRDHGGTLPPDVAADLMAQICDGLAAAHALGIVHRDLKPGNVLMDGGRARLTDFGIARIGGEASVTTAGMVLGTVCYMAPEALSGAEPAPACDVYAAGVTLYELLAGRPPFTGQPAVVITGHLHTVPPRPDGIPEPLWRLTAACLDKDPACRPTAAQLAAALRRPEITAGGRPVQPGSPVQSGGPAQPGGSAQPGSSAQTGNPWEPGPWESGSRWQQPASQWEQSANPVSANPVSASPVSASPVQRETTEPFAPEAKPRTMTGIGWLSPAGPVSPPVFGNEAAFASPPAPPANMAPANAKGEAPRKRRRAWLIAAAALLLVAAGAGAAAALSGGSSTPQANSATDPATTGQASLAGLGRSVSTSQAPSPSPSQSTSAATPSPAATTPAAANPSPSPAATTAATTSPATTSPSPAASPSMVTVTATATATAKISLTGKTVTNLKVTEINAATNGSNGSVQVTWNQVDGATSYKVYMEVKGSFTTDRTLANEGGLAAGNHEIQITPEPGGAPVSIAFVVPK